MSSGVQSIAELARRKSLDMAVLSSEDKNKLLLKIADNLRLKSSDILVANQADCTKAQEMVKIGDLSQALYNRLVLNQDKVGQLSVYMEEVAKLADPVGKQQSAMKLAEELELYRVSCPLGVVSVIFESRPEVVVQVTALAIKSGNSVILKGGSEAVESNRQLFAIIEETLAEFDLKGAVGLLETREDVAAMLKETENIDLIIPRGSNAFVQYIQNNSKIPVLGHADGICHIYLDKDLDKDMVNQVVVDAKTNYPSACNTMETLLINKEVAKELIPSLFSALQKADVKLKGDADVLEICKDSEIIVEQAVEEDWKTEYSDLILSVKLVNSLEEAVKHINYYGSGHTDSILTNNQRSADFFISRVDSACVFHNCSTRFSDGYVFGLGAEVGISTNKTHARGPVGLEGLIIYKYILKGNGQIKASFTGKNAEKFLHQVI